MIRFEEPERVVRMKALDLQTICTFIVGNDRVVMSTSEAHLGTWNGVSGEMVSRRVGVRASLEPFAREHHLTHTDGGRRSRFFASRGIGLPDGIPEAGRPKPSMGTRTPGITASAAIPNSRIFCSSRTHARRSGDFGAVAEVVCLGQPPRTMGSRSRASGLPGRVCGGHH